MPPANYPRGLFLRGSVFRDKGFEQRYDGAVVREHLAHAWLEGQLRSCGSDGSSSSRAEATRAARDEQAALCVALRKNYEAWTGRSFRMRAECIKFDDPQCERRRTILDGGRNHSHWLAGDDLPEESPPDVEATYRGVAEMRRGAARVGAGLATGRHKALAVADSPFVSRQLQGPNLAVARRADILGEHVAAEHRKYAVAEEARENSERRFRLKASRKRLIVKAARREAAVAMEKAIKARDLGACVSLCRGGSCDKNAETPAGTTALQAAVLQQDRPAASALAEAGVLLDYPARATGFSGLALAARRGDAVMVHHLLDLGASASMPFAYKRIGATIASTAEPLFQGESPEQFSKRSFVTPPLAAATSTGQLMTIDVLCEETERNRGPEGVARLLDQPFGPKNYTALHVAVARRDLRTAIHLVKRGARTELGDARGLSPSELAIHARQPRTGDYLRKVRRVGRDVVITRKDQELERTALLQYARLERAIESGGVAAKKDEDPKSSSLAVIRAGDVAPDQETRTGTTALFVASSDRAGKSRKHLKRRRPAFGLGFWTAGFALVHDDRRRDYSGVTHAGATRATGSSRETSARRAATRTIGIGTCGRRSWPRRTPRRSTASSRSSTPVARTARAFTERLREMTDVVHRVVALEAVASPELSLSGVLLARIFLPETPRRGRGRARR